jgi:hypothetical protein
MTVFGSNTTCSSSAHDVGTPTPVPGLVYFCRKCGARVLAGSGPSVQVGAYPGDAAITAAEGS